MTCLPACDIALLLSEKSDFVFIADALRHAPKVRLECRKPPPLKDFQMKFSGMAVAGLAIVLSACTTTPTSTSGGSTTNAVEARWKGQSAGKFFAQFGPPVSDTEEGSTTVYNWRGGYKTERVAAKYATGTDGKRGALISPARTLYLSCSVQLTASSDYTIRSIRTVSDRPGVNGPSYCAEFLAPAQ